MISQFVNVTSMSFHTRFLEILTFIGNFIVLLINEVTFKLKILKKANKYVYFKKEKRKSKGTTTALMHPF